MAYRITKSQVQAEEIAQETFLRLMTTRPWDESRQPVIERHLFGIIKSLVSHERTSRRSDYESRGAAEHAITSGGETPSAEVRGLERARRERQEAIAAARVRLLRTKPAGHELELMICDLMAEGITKPADLARHTGRSVAEVNVALARIRRYMKSILAAERGEDEEVA
jgi:DNA-directed RNA polymerase specialized sigma24 family protein